MLTKCICTNCAGHLEFEEENAGESIPCPHCGFETTLFLPGMEPDRPAPPVPLWRWLWRQIQGNRRNRTIAALLVLAGLGYALYRWGAPWLQDLFPSIESRALATTILALSLMALPFLVLWLILPWLLLRETRKLSRAIAGMAEAFEAARPEAEPDAEESELQIEAAGPGRPGEATPPRATVGSAARSSTAN
jgi:hypothetical protein